MGVRRERYPVGVSVDFNVCNIHGTMSTFYCSLSLVKRQNYTGYLKIEYGEWFSRTREGVVIQWSKRALSLRGQAAAGAKGSFSF